MLWGIVTLSTGTQTRASRYTARLLCPGRRFQTHDAGTSGAPVRDDRSSAQRDRVLCGDPGAVRVNSTADHYARVPETAYRVDLPWQPQGWTWARELTTRPTSTETVRVSPTGSRSPGCHRTEVRRGPLGATDTFQTPPAVQVSAEGPVTVTAAVASAVLTPRPVGDPAARTLPRPGR